MAIQTIDAPIKQSITRSPSKVVLQNDEVNSFDHVIETLIKVLNVSEEQAQDFANTAHFTGRAVVYEGQLEICEHYAQQLNENNLTAYCD